jgi:acyl-CoA thioesterase FadM
LFNEAGTLLTEGITTLVFIDAATGRPRGAPADLLVALAPFFK